MNSWFFIIIIVGAVKTDSLLDELIREFDDYVDKRDVSPTVPGSSTRPIMTSQHPTSHTGSSISHNPSSKSPGVTSTNKPHTSTKNPHTSTNNPHTSHTRGTASHKPSGSPKVTATHKPTSAIPGGTATGQPKTKPSTSNPTGSPTQHRSTLYPPQTYPTEEKIKYYNSTGGHTTSKSAGKSTTPGMGKSSTMSATSKPSVTATQPNPVFPSRVPWVNSPQFTCPVFERILFQYFRGFPKLDDISENIQTTTREFEPIFKKALSIYENIRKPGLVIDNLVEEVTQAMLARRMRCPATKYQQTLTFVLRREAKRAISSNTESLREQIHSLIQGSKDSRTLANKLATEVAEIVYENLVKSILREEFKEMDYVIRRLRAAAMKGFMKIESHPRLDRDEWVRTSLAGWYHEHSSQFMAALRCSTLQQLRDEQSNILQDFLSGYYEKEQSGAVLHLTRDMITRMLKEHGGDTANTDYVFFPMDKVTAKILHFTREVMNRTRKYEESLYDDHLSNAAKILHHLLEPGQKTVLYEILRHLESSESKVTTPGPTKSVVPLGLYRHVKEDIKILEKLKYVLDLEGKLAPHIKELIMNRIKEKTALLATLKTTHL